MVNTHIPYTPDLSYPLLEGVADSLFTDILARGNDLRVRVTGASMKPFIKTNDMVVLRKVSAGHLKTGDIILCRPEGSPLTLHRIVRQTSKKGKTGKRILTTKGDGVDACDAPVDETGYLGKVVRVERQTAAGMMTHNMDARPSKVLNYTLGVYYRFKSVLLCRYASFKSRPKKTSVFHP